MDENKPVEVKQDYYKRYVIGIMGVIIFMGFVIYLKNYLDVGNDYDLSKEANSDSQLLLAPDYSNKVTNDTRATLSTDYSNKVCELLDVKKQISNLPDIYNPLPTNPFSRDLCLGADSEVLFSDGKVIFRKREIEEADYDSFQCSTAGILLVMKDKNNVYGLNGKILEGIDAESFVAMARMYGKDKDTVYHIQTSVQIIDEADTDTYEVLNYAYQKDAKNIFSGNSILQDVDHVSFKPVGGNYGKDKNNVFHLSKVLDSANSETFKYTGAHFGKDNKSVYLKSDKFSDYPSDFEVLAANFAKDETSAYYLSDMLNEWVPFADPKTLEVLGEKLSRDANYMYLGVNVIKDFLHPYKIYLDEFVWRSDEMIKVVNILDKDSTELLGYGQYLKDKTDVYCGSVVSTNAYSKIPDADAQSFEIYPGTGYAKDKNSIFFRCKKIPDIDMNTFITCSVGEGAYGADANNVYYQGMIDEKIDRETFQISGSGSVIDKNGTYREGRVYSTGEAN